MEEQTKQIDRLKETYGRLKQEISRKIVGQDKVIDKYWCPFSAMDTAF